jgi:hypothetical protein
VAGNLEVMANVEVKDIPVFDVFLSEEVAVSN